MRVIAFGVLWAEVAAACEVGVPTVWGGNAVCVDPGAVIHPTAVLATGAEVGVAVIGAGVTIGAGSVLHDGASVGAKAVIGAGNVIGADAVIGRRAHLGDDNVVADDAWIAADTVVGHHNRFTGTLTIGYGATVGDRAHLGGDATIGNLSEIGGPATLDPAISCNGVFRVGRMSQVATDPQYTLTCVGDLHVGADVIVGAGGVFGGGTRFARGAQIGAGVTTGVGARVGRNAQVAAGLTIGSGGAIRSGAQVCSDVTGVITRDFYDPACDGDGLCGPTDSGLPECDGACEPGESANGPDCDEVCGVGDGAGSPDCPPPVFDTPSNLGIWVVGQAINLPIVTSGGAGGSTYQLLSGTLPGGIGLTGPSGLLSGVVGSVATDTTHNFTLRATDAAGAQIDRAFSVVVVPRLVPSFTTLFDLGPVVEGRAVNLALSATHPTGAPLTYSVTAYRDGAGNTLPSGVSLSAGGVLSGATPITGAATRYVFDVTAADARGRKATRTFTLHVVPELAPTWSTPTSLGNYLAGRAVNLPLSATGTGTITYAVTSGALPSGLSLGGSGVITGTPSAVGSDTVSTFTVTATDDASRGATRTFTMTVSPSSALRPSDQVGANTRAYATYSSGGAGLLVNQSSSVRPNTCAYPNAVRVFSTASGTWGGWNTNTGSPISYSAGDRIDFRIETGHQPSTTHTCTFNLGTLGNVTWQATTGPTDWLQPKPAYGAPVRSYVQYGERVPATIQVPSDAVPTSFHFTASGSTVASSSMRARRWDGASWGGWVDVASQPFSFNPGDKIELRAETDYRTNQAFVGNFYTGTLGPAGKVAWTVTTGPSDWLYFKPLTGQTTRSYVYYAAAEPETLEIPLSAIPTSFHYTATESTIGSSRARARRWDGGSWGGWFDVASQPFSFNPGDRIELRMELDHRTSQEFVAKFYLGQDGPAGRKAWSVTSGPNDWFKFSSVAGSQVRSYVYYGDTVPARLVIPPNAVPSSFHYYASGSTAPSSRARARRWDGASWGGWFDVSSQPFSFNPGDKIELRMELDHRTNQEHLARYYIGNDGPVGATNWSVTSRATDWFVFTPVTGSQTRSYVYYADTAPLTLVIPPNAVPTSFHYWATGSSAPSSRARARRWDGASWGGWFDVSSQPFSFNPGDKIELRMETDHRTNQVHTANYYLGNDGTPGATTWSVTTRSTDWFVFTPVTGSQTRSYVYYADTVPSTLVIPANAVPTSFHYWGTGSTAPSSRARARRWDGASWGGWFDVSSQPFSFNPGDKIEVRMETDHRTNQVHTVNYYLGNDGTPGATSWSVTTGATDWFTLGLVNGVANTQVTRSGSPLGALAVPMNAVPTSLHYWATGSTVPSSQARARRFSGGAWGPWYDVSSQPFSFNEGELLDVSIDTGAGSGTRTANYYLGNDGTPGAKSFQVAVP
jgi:UDP-3-O-[3-hydroxymyristoyl] glucosamine N-acyltransferase